ncbi:hypothetical protein [Massilia sp. NR 4-1]|uniref:hypothetical protein n=1 Tax=Massilia sp. NR 4-1 TaxID=1678028 RepID=UPI00067DD34B|nr:hypothetical protein [Massilia sp. NR 4-1]AKU22565.1 hypothetical protein ACZ75_14860 [Massilia sp. NR 4-1]
MRNLIIGLFIAAISLSAAAAEKLNMEAAVKLAEKFVAENGYTDLPESRIKPVLDNESLEWTSSRKERLAQRHKMLLPTAIGAKYERKGEMAGWSIAFDYSINAGDRRSCRVVTMAANGSGIRIEHVDGVRKYFAGFEQRAP